MCQSTHLQFQQFASISPWSNQINQLLSCVHDDSSILRAAVAAGDDAVESISVAAEVADREDLIAAGAKLSIDID